MILSRESGVRRQETGDEGFSLIETIITLLVLSIAAVGVMSVFATGIRGSASPLIVDQARLLVQGELDTVIGLKAANGFTDTSLNVGTGQACKTSSTLLTGFNCSLDICYVAQATPDDTGACNTPTSYKRVAVTITNAAAGTNISAVTLLANY